MVTESPNKGIPLRINSSVNVRSSMAVWSEIKKKRGHGISPPCDNKEKLSFVARQEILANIISGCVIIIEQKISFCESKKSNIC